MPSKPAGGFDLVLGHLYNDFWFNAAEPNHKSGLTCYKCETGELTLHKLEKVVLAFGKLTIKTCVVHTCPRCLHEVVVNLPDAPRQKATKQNLVRLFAKLPKNIQIALLGGGK